MSCVLGQEIYKNVTVQQKVHASVSVVRVGWFGGLSFLTCEGYYCGKFRVAGLQFLDHQGARGNLQMKWFKAIVCCLLGNCAEQCSHKIAIPALESAVKAWFYNFINCNSKQ